MVIMKGELTAKCEVTFDANLPANTPKIVNVVVDPVVGAKTEHVVPADREWVIVDIYIKDTADVGVDAIVKVIKNGEEVKIATDPLSTLLISNPSRPRIPPIVFEPNSRLSMEAINLVSIGSSAVTDTFYIKIAQRPPKKVEVGLLKRLRL